MAADQAASPVFSIGRWWVIPEPRFRIHKSTGAVAKLMLREAIAQTYRKLLILQASC